ncbi:MAG: outer membrane protein assembly factor BamE [Candidatus Nucleicultricaceae bacterium]
MYVNKTPFSRLFGTTALVALTLVGCSPRIDQHGKVLEMKAVEQLHPQKQNKDDVLKLLGTPTSVDLFDPNIWFYHSKRTSTTSFFLPETLEQETLVIRFNSSGYIEAMKFTNEDQKDTTIIQRETEVIEPEESILEQIFGSFSRFNERDENQPKS